MITLSNEQADAVLKFAEWWSEEPHRRPPIFTICGYAGTGKSTLIKYLIEGLGIDEQNVAFVAFTGKASLVLRRKGHNAMTIHRLMYQPRLSNYLDEFTGQIKTRVSGFTLKTELDFRIDLIVIDEFSMVSRELIFDLLSFDIPIVALGDPGQLPPVRGHSNGLTGHPDVFLREIHRQACDNPIIWASMLAREGRPIPMGKHGDKLLVIPRASARPQAAAWCDQVIVCTHETRKSYTVALRRLEGRTRDLPEVGEKLVCLKNNWETISDDGLPLVNGTMTHVYSQPNILDERNRILIIGVQQEDGGAKFPHVEANLDWFRLLPGREPDTHANIAQFRFGNAITCHSAQGSEWRRVWFVNDGFGDAKTRRELLYTGLTRASDEMVLCM